MKVDALLTREELGDMYFDLEATAEFVGYNFWGTPRIETEPTEGQKKARAKMEDIRQYLGDDYIFSCKLKQQIKCLETHLNDQIKNNDELEERIERLEECIVELYSKKKDKSGTKIFTHCESPVPSKAGETYTRTLRF